MDDSDVARATSRVADAVAYMDYSTPHSPKEVPDVSPTAVIDVLPLSRVSRPSEVLWIRLMDHRWSRTYRMPAGIALVPALFCAQLFITQVLADLPYTPSSLLYTPEQNTSFAYLLRSSEADSRNRIEFLSLNIFTEIDASNPPYTLLLEDVPFRSGARPSAYIPAIDEDGVIKIFTGDCWGSNNSDELWQFVPDINSSVGNGTWEKFLVSQDQGQIGFVTQGPNYLSAGFTFASSNTTESSFYAFAGMCPLSNTSNANWIAAANYSQSMILLDPPVANDDDYYKASTTGDRAPPIPEAGFTITPLKATHAYTEGEERQQQDFLLIGGHTQQAFINMSELALFSAPQNSWSFVTVESISETSQTELAIRETPLIEPRSGHTAVLSTDGSKVIVFGGWVGNTSIPAMPQLVILDIGGGYAGSGNWKWTIPSTSGAGFDEGVGIYGHAATMLPGEVMAVTGGYHISQLSKRSSNGHQPNSKTYLYNVTADSWAAVYENPLAVRQQNADNRPSNSQSSSPRKVGLGVGLGLGIPALASLAIFTFYFCRRRRVRRTRDKELRKLALGAERPHFWGRDDGYMASSVRRPSMVETEENSDYPWSNNSNSGKRTSWHDTGDTAAERTGLLGGIPSPTKPTQLGLSARMYRPPLPYDYKRKEVTGDIHPIDEGEEDETCGAENTDMRETDDHFTDPPFLTPQETRVEPTIYDLKASPKHSDIAAAVAFMDGEGSSLPDNSDRTSSNLSDSSRSAKSAHFSRGSMPPSGSQSPDRSTALPSYSRDTIRTRDSGKTAIFYEKRYSSDSYSTAQTSLSQRQAEGEHLLQQSDRHSEASTFLDLFPKPTSNNRPRATEWIGNVRRVLSASLKRPPTDLHSLNRERNNTASLASGIEGRDTVTGIPQMQMRIPQRSVSASAELFRRKRGAKDWGADPQSSREKGLHSARSTRDDFGVEEMMDLDSDEDWDVEGAVEGRRVQVTFTVPKERLRVVNATSTDNLDNLSEKSLSRSNSAS